jgi:hypothetical protein
MYCTILYCAVLNWMLHFLVLNIISLLVVITSLADPDPVDP